MVAAFKTSSKTTPCPVCDRTHDKDCRILESGNLILCHTHQDQSGPINGYEFIRHSDKGAGWGVWVSEKPKKAPRPSNLRQEFFYNDRNGNRLVRVTRQGRDFYQSHWNGQKWVNGLTDEIRQRIPVYRYAEVQTAIASGKPIFWVEGEGCADTLWKLGIAATTTIGGCKGYNSYGNYSNDLDGAEIVLCPDRDKSGMAYMELVAADYPGIRWCKVYPKSPLWQRLPESGGLDVADWVTDGATIEQIMGAIEQPATPVILAPTSSDESKLDEKVAYLKLEINRYLRTADTMRQTLIKTEVCRKFGIQSSEFDRIVLQQRHDEKTNSRKPRMLTLAEMFAMESEALQFLVDGWMPMKDSVLLTGLTGASKSMLSIDLAFAVATGGKWMGDQCRKGKILILNSDQNLGVTRTYLTDRGFNPNDENVRVIGECTEMAAWTVKDLESLELWLEEFRPDLVIIDSIRTTICYPLGIEEKSEMVGHWIKEVNNLVNRYGTVLWIHHDSKSTEAAGVNKSSGSTAIVSNNSFHWNIENPSKDTRSPHRNLKVFKCRRVEPQQVEIDWNHENNSFTLVRRIGESPEVTAQRMTMQQSILRLLQEYPEGQWVEGSEIKHRLNSDSAYVVLNRMVARGIVSMQPISDPGKRGKRYRLEPQQCDSSVTNTPLTNTPPSYTPTHTHPDTVSNSETTTNTTLQTTNTLTNTLLTLTNTPPNSKQSVSNSNPYGEGNQVVTNSVSEKGDMRVVEEGVSNSATVTVERQPPTKDAKPIGVGWSKIKTPVQSVITPAGVEIKVGDRVFAPDLPPQAHPSNGLLVTQLGNGYARLEMIKREISIAGLSLWDDDAATWCDPADSDVEF